MGCRVDAEADQWIEWDAVSLQVFRPFQMSGVFFDCLMLAAWYLYKSFGNMPFFISVRCHVFSTALSNLCLFSL